MNFELALFGFLFAICAVADAVFSPASQSSEYCDSACPMTCVSDYVKCKQTECTSSDSDSTCSAKMKSCCTKDVDSCLWNCNYNCTRDLQTMCDSLALLSGSSVLSLNALVDVCLNVQLLNIANVKTLLYADVGILNSAPSEAGSSQYEKVISAVLGIVVDIKTSVLGDSKLNLAALIVDILGSVLSGSNSSSGTGCSQSGESSNLLDIIANVFVGLGLSGEDSKNASNNIILAILGIDLGSPSGSSNLLSIVTKALVQLKVGGDISSLASSITSTVESVLESNNSTSGSGCSESGDSSNILNILIDILINSGRSQDESSILGLNILNILLGAQVDVSGILSTTAKAAVAVA